MLDLSTFFNLLKLNSVFFSEIVVGWFEPWPNDHGGGCSNWFDKMSLFFSWANAKIWTETTFCKDTKKCSWYFKGFKSAALPLSLLCFPFWCLLQTPRCQGSKTEANVLNNIPLHLSYFVQGDNDWDPRGMIRRHHFSECRYEWHKCTTSSNFAITVINFWQPSGQISL